MNNVEYLRLMRVVQAAWPAWKLTADSFEFAEPLLAEFDFNSALVAVQELTCEFVEYPPASLGVIRKKILEGSTGERTVDHLYLEVIEWLKADEAWRLYDEDCERHYGLDRWVDPGPPQRRPVLSKQALGVIDQGGGPDALYDALVVRGDTTKIAQFKKLLSTVSKEPVVVPKAIESAQNTPLPIMSDPELMDRFIGSPTVVSD